MQQAYWAGAYCSSQRSSSLRLRCDTVTGARISGGRRQLAHRHDTRRDRLLSRSRRAVRAHSARRDRVAGHQAVHGRTGRDCDHDGLLWIHRDRIHTAYLVVAHRQPWRKACPGGLSRDGYARRMLLLFRSRCRPLSPRSFCSAACFCRPSRGAEEPRRRYWSRRSFSCSCTHRWSRCPLRCCMDCCWDGSRCARARYGRRSRFTRPITRYRCFCSTPRGIELRLSSSSRILLIADPRRSPTRCSYGVLAALGAGAFAALAWGYRKITRPPAAQPGLPARAWHYTPIWVSAILLVAVLLARALQLFGVLGPPGL